MLRLIRESFVQDRTALFENSARAILRPAGTGRPCRGQIALPDDLRPHSDAQTEWWFYTAHCETEGGSRFGFELVFFRRRTDHDRIGFLPLKYLANPMYAAHFAFTNIDEGRFLYSDRRGSGGMLGHPSAASDSEFEIRVGDWNASGDEKRHRLCASIGKDLVIDARLESAKPVVLNGHRNAAGSSRHFSFTRMLTSGTIRRGTGSERFEGTAWMDREYGTWFQRHWDWFSIQLENGCELMLYIFRDVSGRPMDTSHGNFIGASGRCQSLSFGDFQITAKRIWTSARTGTEYPSGWKISVPSLKIELDLEPFVEDQELNTARSTMVVYWEGACSVTGSVEGKECGGNAYVELVGYDNVSEGLSPLNFLRGLWPRRK
ncbi:MAG: hypothetical protein J5I65_08875 [Aridibacter famidurans]|nr:hypothetical protein [Aridibacter famidurans]